MAEIRVTPETLESQGNDLVEYAGNLTEILNSINTKINEIIGGWDGLAQDAYFEMYETMKKSLDEFPNLVDSLGQATTAAAQAYATVDDELKNSFAGAV